MNILWKLVLGVLFWELVEGCDEVPENLEFEEFELEEMECEDAC
jgi:hypothetical protein